MHSTMDRTITDMAGGLLDVGLVSSAQRQEREGLTASDSPEFAVLWREVAHRVTLFLRRLGASRELADDLVQDVAVRLLRSDLKFAEGPELLKWSYVVARNLYIDHLRRPESLGCDPAELPETAAQVDVVRTVEARLALAHVGRLLRAMNESDRDALLRIVQDEPEVTPHSRRESTRLAVQRHRARNRLQDLIAATAALLGVLWAQFRRFGGSATVAAAYAAPLLVLAMLPLYEGEGGQPDLLAQPVVVQTTTAPSVGREDVVPAERLWVHRAAVRPETARAAETSREDVKVVTPVPGVRVRSGTTPNPNHHLVCVGIGFGLDDVCVTQPRPVGSVPLAARIDAVTLRS